MSSSSAPASQAFPPPWRSIKLERVREIAEVGAGIQMAPNAARILGRLGLLEKVMEKANVLEMNSLRRYKNDEELGKAELMPSVCYTISYL